MLAGNIIYILIVLSICNGNPTFNQNCLNDTIDFTTKVKNSSIVVYGKTVGKILYGENDSKFHVLFRVDCIFKGPAIEKQINITQAGRINGKKYCQEYPFDGSYTIAFLERNPLNKNDSKIFIPSDFVEISFKNNLTNQLLTNTCNLQQILPLGSSPALITDVCPAVSTNFQCINTTMKTNIELTTISTNLSSIIISGGSQNDIDYIRSKSGMVQVDIDKKSGINSINISILLILMAIFFVQFN